MLSEFGALVGRLRLNKGWGQAALARQIGVSQTHIFRIESGEMVRPPRDLIERLATALDIDVNILLEAATPKYPEPKETPESLIAKLQLALEKVKVPHIVRIPVVADIHAPTGPEDDIDVAYWATTKVAERNIVGVRVHGYCLEPDIHDGDIIFIDRDACPDVNKVLLCYHNNHDKLKLVRYFSESDLKDLHYYGVVVEVNRRL